LRPRDILAIAEKLLAREADGVRLSPDAKAALLAHAWPGNARELVHALRLALLLREGNHLHANDLRLEPALTRDAYEPAPTRDAYATAPPRGAYEEVSHRVSSGASVYGSNPDVPSREPCAAPEEIRTLEELEAEAIRAAHLRHHGHRRAMAEELGIAKSSLLRKLGALGLRG